MKTRIICVGCEKEMKPSNEMRQLVKVDIVNGVYTEFIKCGKD